MRPQNHYPATGFLPENISCLKKSREAARASMCGPPNSVTRATYMYGHAKLAKMRTTQINCPVHRKKYVGGAGSSALEAATVIKIM